MPWTNRKPTGRRVLVWWILLAACVFFFIDAALELGDKPYFELTAAERRATGRLYVLGPLGFVIGLGALVDSVHYAVSRFAAARSKRRGETLAE